MTRLAAILMLGVATGAGAQELHSADFLVGKWSCAHSVGDFKGTYTTTISSALDGQWLRQTYDFPDKRAEFFLGYDPRFQRWVRWGMLSTGEYWAMTAVRADTTWTWSYALPRRPGSGTYTDKRDAVWTKKRRSAARRCRASRCFDWSVRLRGANPNYAPPTPLAS
jgi:hypothetical protein